MAADKCRAAVALALVVGAASAALAGPSPGPAPAPSSAPAQAADSPHSALNQTSTAAPNYLETGRQITAILNRFMAMGYDKRVRPNYGGPPVEVNVTMRILSISSVSEVMMDFTADFYFRQTWHDPRLSFKKLGDIQTLYVGAEVSKKIWLPDTFFGNEKLAYFHEATTPNVFLRIDHSGEVYRSIRLTVTSSCPMNLQYFPMDRQRCTIEAESYGYNVRDIIYRWARKDTAVERDKEISLPQFDIVRTVQKYRLEELSSGTYSRLIAEIHFARRMGYYLIQIYIPSSLIVVISWVSFWLHRNASPARVQLGVTTVLTMTTLMSSTNAALPKISYVKSIDIFLGTCFVMVFAALLEYATVGYLGKRIAMRKAQAQHATAQAQARLFAQLQAQGAQGDPAGLMAPPSFASAAPTVDGGTIGVSEPSPSLLTAQQQAAMIAGEPVTPYVTDSMAGGLATPQLPFHVLDERMRAAAATASATAAAVAAAAAASAATTTTTAAAPGAPANGRTGAGEAANQLPPQAPARRHCQSCLAATARYADDAPASLTHQQQLHRHIHLHHPQAPHAAASATCRAGAARQHHLPLDQQPLCAANFALGAEKPPPPRAIPPFGPGAGVGVSPSATRLGAPNSGAAKAATAAAATFINLHRQRQGLPPSNNPNFAPFTTGAAGSSAVFGWGATSMGGRGNHHTLDTIFGVRPSDIDKYSRVVFPVCFVCFQLMYWIVYLHISAFLESDQPPSQRQPLLTLPAHLMGSGTGASLAAATATGSFDGVPIPDTAMAPPTG